MRREIPLFLTIFFGCMMVIGFFVPHPIVNEARSRVEEWTIILAAAAVVLGVANVARIHMHKISRRDRDFQYSFPLLFALFLMIALGVVPKDWITSIGFPAGGTDEGSPFDWLYNNAYVPMQGTMFALLAFYIASAAFRAFRIRTIEAALLAITAVLVMIGRVPVGGSISDWFNGLIHVDLWTLPEIQQWIMDIPNLAAKRAILIGAALGAIATSLKIILGIERSAIGGD
ncbi:MAG: hypothetical protein R3E97_08015 [Candidatus Eisenbacteria bacterium]